MLKEVFVYISGPITAKNGNTIEENVAAGLKAFLALTKLGIPSFSPHVLAAFPSAHEIHYSIWMAYDLIVVENCTHMLMLPKWEESEGSMMEKAHAESYGLPVLYTIPDLAKLLNVKE